MITISAFADEIGPSLQLQMDTCEANGIRCIDVRGIDNTNVSKFTDEQAAGYRKQMDDRGFRVPCIGSPIGKIRMDECFEAHMDLLKHCCDIAKAFGTDYIRVFSFYPSEGENIQSERAGVMDRMAKMVAYAESVGIVLLHENEKAIYGALPDGVKDIFATIKSGSLKGVFDPANYVEEGIRPFDDGWQKGLGDLTHYMHIKDKNPSESTCVPAGRGAGQIPQILADLKRRNWSGFMTLEPHMSKAGQFSGFTGPQLFAEAVNSLKMELDKAGLEH